MSDFRYREVTFDNGETGLVNDIPGSLEITLPQVTSEREITADEHDALNEVTADPSALEP